MRIENDTINYYKRNVSRYVSQTHTPTHFNIIIKKKCKESFQTHWGCLIRDWASHWHWYLAISVGHTTARLRHNVHALWSRPYLGRKTCRDKVNGTSVITSKRKCIELLSESITCNTDSAEIYGKRIFSCRSETIVELEFEGKGIPCMSYHKTYNHGAFEESKPHAIVYTISMDNLLFHSDDSDVTVFLMSLSLWSWDIKYSKVNHINLN